MEVKLLGETPTLYCWKVVTLEEVWAPQKVPAVWLTPKTLKDLLKQQVLAAVHPELAEQAVPTEGATAVWLMHDHVWLRPPKRTVLPLRIGLMQVFVTLVAVAPLILL